jgi:TP901 family phage tail tape measure protein
MPAAFNLTVQMNMQAPKNMGSLRGALEKGLSGLKATVDVQVNKQGLNTLTSFNNQLQNLQKNLHAVTADVSRTASAFGSLGSHYTTAARGVGAMTAAHSTATNQMRQLNRESQQAVSVTEQFGRQAGLAARRFLAFSVAAGSIYTVVHAMRDGVREAIRFEREMVKLTQQGATTREVADMEKAITKLSTSLGVSSNELAQVAVTFQQTGMAMKDVERATQAVAKAALAPNFGSIKQATEGAISVMRVFNVDAGQMEKVLSSINSVAGAFASESRDLIVGIQRAGASFAAAGGNLNQLLALMSTVRSTTRESAESIATGLKTIFARMERRSTIESLKELGIQLRYTEQEAKKLGDTNLTGQFVGPYEAILRVSSALKGLRSTDVRYMGIVEEMGGYRQVTKLLPMLQQVAEAQKAYTIAQYGGINISNVAAQAQKTLLVRLQAVREQFLALFRTILGSDAFKAFTNNTIRLAESLLKVANAMTPLMPLLMGLAAVKIGRGIGGFMRNAENTMLGGPMPKRFSTGGGVGGSGNSDNQLILATPGEFVVRKQAVQSVGVGALRHINQNGRLPGIRGYTNGDIIKSEGEIDPEMLAKIKQEFANQGINLANYGRAHSFKFDKNTGAYKGLSTNDISQKEALAMLSPERMAAFWKNFGKAEQNAQQYAYRGDDIALQTQEAGERGLAIGLLTHKGKLSDFSPGKYIAQAVRGKAKDLTRGPRGNTRSGMTLTDESGESRDIFSEIAGGRDKSILDQVTRQEEMAEQQAVLKGYMTSGSGLNLDMKQLRAAAKAIDPNFNTRQKKAVIEQFVRQHLNETLGQNTPLTAGPEPVSLPAVQKAVAQEGAKRVRTTRKFTGMSLPTVMGTMGLPLVAPPGAPPDFMKDVTMTPISGSQFTGMSLPMVAGTTGLPIVRAPSVMNLDEEKRLSGNVRVSRSFLARRQAAKAGLARGVGNLTPGPGGSLVYAGGGTGGLIHVGGATPSTAGAGDSDIIDVPFRVVHPLGYDPRDIVHKPEPNFSRTTTEGEVRSAHARRRRRARPDIYGVLPEDAHEYLEHYPPPPGGPLPRGFRMVEEPKPEELLLGAKQARMHPRERERLRRALTTNNVGIRDFDYDVATRYREQGFAKGGLGDAAAHLADKEIEARGGAKKLSETTRLNILNQKREQVEKDLVEAESRLLQKLRPGLQREEALLMATEQLGKAREGLAQVVRNEAGQIVGTEGSVSAAMMTPGMAVPAGVQPGFLGRVRGGISGIGNRIRGSRLYGGLNAVGTKLNTTLGMGMMFAGAGLSHFIEGTGGTADQAVESGGTGGFRTAQAASGMITGISTGAFVGSMFGPVGTAVGAVGGALVGLATSIKSSSDAIRDAELGQAVQEVRRNLELMKVGGPGSEQLAKKQNSALDRAYDKINSRAADSASHFFTGFDTQEYLKKSREEFETTFGADAGKYAGFLNRAAEDLGKNNLGANIKDLEETFRKGNQGLNNRYLSILAQLNHVSPSDVLKDFMKVAQQSQMNAQSESLHKSADMATTRELAQYQQLYLAAEQAAQGLADLKSQAQNVANVFGNQFAPIHVAGGVGSGITNLGGPDRGLFRGSLAAVSSPFGSLGADFRRSGEALDEVSRNLPNAIAQAMREGPMGGSDLPIRITSTLKEMLGGDKAINGSPEMRNAMTVIAHGLNELKTEKIVEQTQAGDVHGLVNKVMDPLTSAFKQVGGQVSKLLTERANEFTNALHEAARMTRQIIEGDYRVAQARLAQTVQANQIFAQSIGRRHGAMDLIPLSALQAPFIARQQALTGFAGPQAMNPAAIGQAMTKAKADLDKAVKARDLEAHDMGRASQEAEQRIHDMQTRVANLNDALSHLRNTTETTAAAQEKLKMAEEDRTSRLAFGERFMSSDLAGRSGMLRGLRLVQVAGRQGHIDNFSPTNQRLVMETLNSLGNAKLTFMGGVRAQDLKNTLIERAYGGVFKMDNGSQKEYSQLQNSILDAFKTARAAEEELQKQHRDDQTKFITLQEQLQKNFFSKLEQYLMGDKLRNAEAQRATLAGQRTSMGDEARASDVLRRGGIGATASALERYQTGHVRGILQNLEKHAQAIRANNSVGANDADVYKELRNFVGKQDYVFNHGPFVSGAFNKEGSGKITDFLKQLGVEGEQTQGALDRVKSVTERNLGNHFYVHGQNGKDAVESAVREVVGGIRKRKNSGSQREFNNSLNELTGAGFNKDETDSLRKLFLDLGKGKDFITALGNVKADRWEELPRIIRELDESLKGLDATINGMKGNKPASGYDVLMAHKAGGGLMRPRGTDTIPAMLTPGEFVVNAKDASKNRGVLNAINSGYYAQGGLVGHHAPGVHMQQPQVMGLDPRLRQMVNAVAKEFHGDKLAAINALRQRGFNLPVNIEQMVNNETVDNALRNAGIGEQNEALPGQMFYGLPEAVARTQQKIGMSQANTSVLRHVYASIAMKARYQQALVARQLKQLYRIPFAKRNQQQVQALLQAQNMLASYPTDMKDIRRMSKDHLVNLIDSAMVGEHAAAIKLAPMAPANHEEVGKRAVARAQKRFGVRVGDATPLSVLRKRKSKALPVIEAPHAELHEQLTGPKKHQGGYEVLRGPKPPAAGYEQLMGPKPPVGDYGMLKGPPPPGGGYNVLMGPKKRPPHFATGGFVNGGSGVDDVHAMLSHGEYVLRPEAVRSIGRSNLDAANRGGQTRRNGGGQGPSLQVPRDFTKSLDNFTHTLTNLSHLMTNFSGSANALAKAMEAMPHKVDMNGQFTHHIVITGAEALASLTPTLGKMVEECVEKKVNKVMKDKFPSAGPF